MKSLPEKEMIDEVRKRLANYTEEPDEDDWDKLAVAIPTAGASVWLNRTVVALLLLSLFSLIWFVIPSNEYSISGKGENHLAKQNRELTKQSQKVIIEADSCLLKIAESSRHELESTDHQMPIDYSTHKNITSLVSSHEGQENKVKNEVANSDEQLTNVRNLSAGEDNSLISSSSFSSLAQSTPEKNIFNGDTIPVSKDSLIQKIEVSDTLKESKREEKEEKKKIKFKPTVYFSATPSLAFQKITPFHNDEMLITKLNSKGIFSGDRIGLTIDAGFQWQLTKKIQLYSGFSYYQQNSSISYSYQSGSVKEIDHSANTFTYLLTPGEGSDTFEYKMKNIGASVGFLYLLQGVKLQHKIGAGLQYQRGLLKAEENSNYKNHGSTYLNYQVIYRIEFLLNPKYHFYMQPNYTHVLVSKENMNGPFNVKPYRAGIGIGMIYYF